MQEPWVWRNRKTSSVAEAEWEWQEGWALGREWGTCICRELRIQLRNLAFILRTKEAADGF
jgi:hypothetical protein